MSATLSGPLVLLVADQASDSKCQSVLVELSGAIDVPTCLCLTRIRLAANRAWSGDVPHMVCARGAYCAI